ncbi:MAG: YqiA/YcfP family alpha/beta fold hydrolase [Sulfurisoma sp.]|nr:YqiA/YcfP family alpha/beta fold hydrolase [Sulfurisoma sp.]
MILYLHGFTSGPQSRKAQMLAARVAERGGEFICPQLPHSPKAAIALAEDIVVQKVGAGETVALVGSSLGGYYATYLAGKHGLRAVLVNPAVVAHISLEQFVGPQQNLYSGERFDFTREHIAELRALEVPRISRPENFWLLVETGDAVLDYRQAVARYAGARQTVLAGGDHSFTRWADCLDPILEFADEHPV